MILLPIESPISLLEFGREEEAKKLISDSLHEESGFLRCKDEMLSLLPIAVEKLRNEFLSVSFYEKIQETLKSNLKLKCIFETDARFILCLLILTF